MSTILKSIPLRIAGLLAIGAVAGAALLVPRAAPAQAQGIMSAPACQCSAPTSIASTSSRIVHCICGVMACAVTESGDAGGRGTQMQCVRQ